jgi:hypothetical protein
MTANTKCRAKGGVTNCTDPNCPEKTAQNAQREAFIADAVAHTTYAQHPNGWLVEYSSEVLTKQRNEMTAVFNNQEQTLASQQSNAATNERLQGFRHARDMINAVVQTAPIDGTDLGKLMARVSRQKNPQAGDQWVAGVKDAAHIFNRVYGMDIARARYRDKHTR